MPERGEGTEAASPADDPAHPLPKPFQNPENLMKSGFCPECAILSARSGAYFPHIPFG